MLCRWCGDNFRWQKWSCSATQQQGIIRCRAGSGYLRQQIRGGRKGRTECQGLGQSPNEEHGGGGIEISKSSRRQPCFCCQWHLSATFRSVWCTWTLRMSDYPWKPRNSPRSMPLLGFTNFGESAWMFSFLRCEAVLLATMNLLL